MSGRVRCAECSNFTSGRCSVKKDSVVPKKWRLCNSYSFAPEKKIITQDLPKINISPWYFMSSKEKKLLKRLMEAGINVVPNAVPVESTEDTQVSSLKSTAGFSETDLKMPKVGPAGDIIGFDNTEGQK